MVSSLADAVPSGSHVALYHLASDLGPDLAGAARQWNRILPGQHLALRSGPAVAGLVAGLDPVEPGLVPVTEWRPEPVDSRPVDPEPVDPEPGDVRPAETVPVHGIVARKP